MILLQLTKDYRDAYDNRIPSKSYNREWAKVKETKRLFFTTINSLNINQLKSYFNEFDNYNTINGIKLNDTSHYNFLMAYKKRLKERILQLEPQSSEYSISLQDDELVLKLNANPKILSSDLGRYILLIWNFKEIKEYYKTKKNLCIRYRVNYGVFKRKVKLQYEKDLLNLKPTYLEKLELIIDIETDWTIKKKAIAKYSELLKR